MQTVDPRWSLDALLRDYHPDATWSDWFADAYAEAMEAARPEERLEGWKTAATIFGDMHANVFCLFVCHHGLTLEPADDENFLSHIDLCLWQLGLARPTQPDAGGAVRVLDLGKPEAFRRDVEVARDWLAEQLQPFGGDVGRAAVFAMRLTAAQFGLVRGPPEPTIAQVLDESLWERIN